MNHGVGEGEGGKVVEMGNGRDSALVVRGIFAPN